MLSVDEQGRVGLYGLRIDASQVRLSVRHAADWADYVFTPGYRLRPLAEVESYVKDNGHLPGIPSSEKVVAEGIDMGSMNAKLLEKVEELTLYLIEQKKELADLRQEVSAIKKNTLTHLLPN